MTLRPVLTDGTEFIAFGVIIHVFCHLLIFFKINFFQKLFVGIRLECQTFWIHISAFCYRTVCKSYQWMKLAGKELKKGGGVITYIPITININIYLIMGELIN